MTNFWQEVQRGGVIGGDQSQVYRGGCLKFDLQKLLDDVWASTGVARVGEVKSVTDGVVERGTAVALLVEARVCEALARKREELHVEVCNGQELAEIKGERTVRALLEREGFASELSNSLKDDIAVRL